MQQGYLSTGCSRAKVRFPFKGAKGVAIPPESIFQRRMFRPFLGDQMVFNTLGCGTWSGWRAMQCESSSMSPSRSLRKDSGREAKRIFCYFAHKLIRRLKRGGAYAARNLSSGETAMA